MMTPRGMYVSRAGDDSDGGGPRLVGLVVCVSASHTVGRGFASRPGHNKDHHKNGTNRLPALKAYVRVGV